MEGENKGKNGIKSRIMQWLAQIDESDLQRYVLYLLIAVLVIYGNTEMRNAGYMCESYCNVTQHEFVSYYHGECKCAIFSSLPVNQTINLPLYYQNYSVDN